MAVKEIAWDSLFAIIPPGHTQGFNVSTEVFLQPFKLEFLSGPGWPTPGGNR
jgi:hypothetical protein